MIFFAQNIKVAQNKWFLHKFSIFYQKVIPKGVLDCLGLPPMPVTVTTKLKYFPTGGWTCRWQKKKYTQKRPSWRDKHIWELPENHGDQFKNLGKWPLRPTFVALISVSVLKHAQIQKIRPLLICNRVYIIY